MDVTESIDVIMKLSPFVFVSVVVVSRCGQGFTALVRAKGPLNAQTYRDEILQHHLPLINVTGGIFQHDNAWPHTIAVCRDFLQQNNVHVLTWPARSADLSPIEHFWELYRNYYWLYRMNGKTSPKILLHPTDRSTRGRDRFWTFGHRVIDSHHVK